ncbi:MAG TPA: DUF928 domain-containing protein [Myxococcota bacterium]|nr:DUF928 domain-containing protein [Myxococcota bacterium]
MKKSLLAFFCLGVLAALATAEDRRPPPPNPAPPPVSAAPGTKQVAAQPELPRWVPPARGAPRMRVGAGTRSAGASKARVEVLSPESIGHTLSASPSLYWHLSDPTQARVDFTLTDDASVKPLVEQTLSGPFTAGVHRIDLTGLGVKLAPGTEYQWFVSLVPDPEERSADVVAGGGVALVDGAPLRAELDAAPADEQALVLARNGIWYDAVDTLSRRIESAPADAVARQQLAALLEQVGLSDIAAEEGAANAP